MPKKGPRGENSKAVEARARKEDKKNEEKDRKAQAEEDARWEDNDKMVLKKQNRMQQRVSWRQFTKKKACTVDVTVLGFF